MIGGFLQKLMPVASCLLYKWTLKHLWSIILGNKRWIHTSLVIKLLSIYFTIQDHQVCETDFGKSNRKGRKRPISYSQASKLYSFNKLWDPTICSRQKPEESRTWYGLIHTKSRIKIWIWNKLMVTKGERWGRQTSWEFEIDVYTWLYLK